jgi:hypothetical protein
MKRLVRGSVALVFCALTSSGLWAAPISQVSPTSDYLIASEGTACIAAETSSSTWAPVLASYPGGPSMEAFDRSLLDLAAVTAAEPAPLSITMLLIGAAMIWLAGAIRYNFRAED